MRRASVRGIATVVDRMKGIGPNIFAEFSLLATKHKATNLGQGFPSFPMPQFVKEAAVTAITENNNQYTRPGGHPALLQTLSTVYSPLFGQNLDPMTNIYTSQGAQMIIFQTCLAFLQRGDQVLVIEPYFDAYVNAARICDAEVVGVPMKTKGHDWIIDMADLAAKISDKTRLLIINTPHNPVGKVTTADEYKAIAEIVKKYPRLIVLSDEVYEHATFDGLPHLRFANMPGMWDRTITAYSAGKTFSCTGWRIGYAIGPAPLITPLIRAQQATTFCNATPLEVACSQAFLKAETNGYYQSYKIELQAKRDHLYQSLVECGLKPLKPQGGYFIMADTSSLPIPAEKDDEDPNKELISRRDFRAARWLTTEIGVTAIPPSAFYTPPNRYLANNLLRFCFVKDTDTLNQARERLKALAKK